MSGDGGDEGLAALGLLILAAGLITLLVMLGVITAGVFFLGIACNVVLRLFPNLLDWSEIDEDWIWPVIVCLLLAPVILALMIVSGPFIRGLEHSWWVMYPAYLVWLAGYFWAWTNPKLELGTADVVMASSTILAWARVKMWWIREKLRLKLAFLRFWE